VARRAPDPNQSDLFDRVEFFPVRTEQTRMGSTDLKRQVATMMGEAIRTCGMTAPQIAAEMTRVLRDDVVTPAQLYAYTAESRTTHTISIVRWIAFVRATGCTWLWDFMLKEDGLLVLEGEEALLAEATLLELRGQKLIAQARQVRARAPSNPSFRKGQVRA